MNPILNLSDAPVNLGLPSGFDSRCAGVQFFGQAVNQFTNALRRPVLGFLDNL